MLGQTVESEVQLLHLNRLDYVQTPPTSVVVARDFRSHVSREPDLEVRILPFGQEEPYVGSDLSAVLPDKSPARTRTISVSIPSGNRYVEPTTSFLCFEFSMTMPKVEPGLFTWALSMNDTSDLPRHLDHISYAINQSRGMNLYTNLFQEARWTHASKREIDYVPEAAHSSYMYHTRQSSDWIRSIGSTYTFPSIELSGVDSYYPDWPEHKVNGSRRPFETVCIPMGVLFPTWRKNKGQYLPAQMVGGSRFDFVMAAPAQSFCIRANDISHVLKPTLEAEFDFGPWRYFIRNCRVVLNERELSSSMNALMWEASASVGTPIQPNSCMVIHNQHPLEKNSNQGLFKERNSDPTHDVCVKNLSRVSSANVTLLAPMSGVWLDAFVPMVRQPLLNRLDYIRLYDYQFSSGNGYWPQKEPTFGADYTGLHSFLQWVWGGERCMNVREWEYWANHFSMNFTRQCGNYESGMPITQERPLDLSCSFVWHTYETQGDQSSLRTIRTIYGRYATRWALDYQMYVNVHGNLLETLE